MKLFWIIAIIIFIPTSAFACSCGPQNLFENYNSIDSIFLGKITESGTESATLKVTKTWKGDINESFTISQPRGKDCTLYINDKNAEYLIFAQKQDDGKYRAYRCAGSAKAKDVTKIIEWLNFGTEGSIR